MKTAITQAEAITLGYKHVLTTGFDLPGQKHLLDSVCRSLNGEYGTPPLDYCIAMAGSVYPHAGYVEVRTKGGRDL